MDTKSNFGCILFLIAISDQAVDNFAKQTINQMKPRNWGFWGPFKKKSVKIWNLLKKPSATKRFTPQI